MFMNNNVLYYVRLSLLIICAIAVQLILFDMKEIYHIDELFSYGLANNDDGVYLFHDASEIDNKLLTGAFFNNYLTQSEDLSFIKMWQNLKFDNHMPLYFVLLHFACSFSSTVFSPTPAIIINIITLILALYAFYKLLLSIFNDKEIALATTTLFAFIPPVLGLEVFIRMYLLQMLCSIFLLKTVYDFMFNKSNLIYILIASTLTILTHFYSIIFCFFVTVAGFIVLILQKRNYDNFKFCFSMLCSVILAYFIYPEMLGVGLSGERGSQFISILHQYLDNPLSLLKQQLPLFIRPLFGNYCLAITAIVAYLSILYFANKRKIINSRDKQIILFFTLIFILFALFLTLVMPNMTSFQIRYFATIIPIYVILIVLMLYYLMRIFNFKKIVIYCFLWLISFSYAFYEAYTQDNPFYFRGSNLSRRIENMIVSSDVWWGLGGGNMHSWIIHNYIDRLIHANNIWTLVDYDNEEFKKFAELEKNQKRYAYLLMPKTQEQQPQGAIDWIKETTGRNSYYLFTVKHDNTAAMAFEASVFLVCPY